MDYLISQGIAQPCVSVMAHAAPNMIIGKRVIGVLPIYLAALAASALVIPLDLLAELRGVDLTEASFSKRGVR